MGAVLILTPVIVSAWPALATAVASAAASLGYTAVKEAGGKEVDQFASMKTGLAIEVPNSEVLTDQLGLDETLSFTRDGVTVTIRRDERGKAALHVNGSGHAHDELKRLGEEMSQRLVRDYVYQQLKHEMQSRNFTLVEETEDETNAIHMTVRHWDH
jgi:NAD/NADP transhydrogenase alpha subunit